MATEFIIRTYGNKEFEIIVKTDSKEHYKAAEDFARRLIDHAKPKTNADRIRAMTDEEMADFFFESPVIEFEVCEYCKNFGGHFSDISCKAELGLCDISDKNQAFKKWLKQPAEVE